MKVNGINLSKRLLAQMRQRFEKSSRIRVKEGYSGSMFDYYLKQFSKRISFQRIADDVGITRQGVHNIYNTHFRDEISDGESGRQRKTARTQEDIMMASRKTPHDPILRAAFRSALKLRCEVGMVQRRNCPSQFCLRSLVVDGEFYAIRRADASWKPESNGSGYFKFQISRDFLLRNPRIVFVGHPFGDSTSVFVVPSDPIIARWNSTKKRKSIYIPMRRPPVERELGGSPAIDWWKYQDAWRESSVAQGA